VTAVSQGRSNRVQTRDGLVMMLALESSSGQPRGFRFKGETATDLWPRWQAGELVLVSEPYAYRQQVAVGDAHRAVHHRGLARASRSAACSKTTAATAAP
jgi:putative ABC transport system permease protein